MSLFDTIRASSTKRPIVVTALIAVLLVAILVAAYVLVIRKPYGVLFTDLRTMDAATIVADLDKKKIPYRLKDNGGTILVPQDLVDSTRLAVMGADLPLKGAVGFELFNKSDMGLTEFAQKINYQRALQGELARTIMSMDGVDTARVHLTIPEPTIFRQDRRPPKASVTILPRRGQTLSASTVRGVQRLVAAAVADLDIANVVILDERGDVVSNDAPRDLSSAGGPVDQETIQQHYAALVRQSLETIYPAEDLDVAVFVDPSARPATAEAAGPAWPTGPRDFRLRISIAMTTPMTPEARAQARTLAAEAIGFDFALGDLITVSTSQPAVQPSVAPPPSVAAPAAAPTASQPAARPASRGLSGWWMGLVAALLLLPIAALVVVIRRQPGPRNLTPAERAEYTRRLSQMLAKEEANAPSR